MPTITVTPDPFTTDPSDQAEFIFDGNSSYGITIGNPRIGKHLGYLLDSAIRFKIPLDGDIHRILFATLTLNNQSSAGPSSPYLIVCRISCEKADNPSDIPTSYSNFQTALGNQTTHTVNWTFGTLSTNLFTSPDIKAVLQEIIERSGWSTNNYLNIYIVSIAPTDATTNYVVFDGPNSGISPTLLINYEDKVPGDTLGHFVSSTLVFDHFITYSINHKYLIDDLIVLQDIAFTRNLFRGVESVLIVDQDVGRTGTKNKDLEDILVITQDITYLREYNVTVYSDIDVSHDPIVNGQHLKQLNDQLDVLQDITVGVIRNRTVIDILSLEQNVHCSPILATVNQILTISQTINYEAILLSPDNIEDTLVVDQTIIVNAVRTRDIQSDITVSQLILVTGNIVSGSIPYPVIYGSYSADNYKTRDPANPTGPPVTPPDPVANKRPDLHPAVTKTAGSLMPNTSVYVAIGENAVTQTNTVLQYPISSPTTTVTLPNPIFGNREELQVTRIQRKALGGDLKVFSDTNWPRIRTLRFQFEHVNDSFLSSYYTFLLLSLGLEIKLTDYEGRIWHGFIITPETESTDTHISTCDNTIGFEFIGVEQ